MSLSLLTARELDVVSCLLNGRGVKKTASLLKISPKTLWNWRQQNLLRGEKIGGKLYFKLSDIQQMMHEHFKLN